MSKAIGDARVHAGKDGMDGEEAMVNGECSQFKVSGEIGENEENERRRGNESE